MLFSGAFMKTAGASEDSAAGGVILKCRSSRSGKKALGNDAQGELVWLFYLASLYLVVEARRLVRRSISWR
jgi:hypothetical protein